MFRGLFKFGFVRASGWRRHQPARSDRSRVNRPQALVIEALESRCLPSFLPPINPLVAPVDAVAVGDFTGNDRADIVTASGNTLFVLLIG